MMRLLAGLILTLLLSGCVSGLKYGETPHSQLSAGQVCNPASAQNRAGAAKPYFAVTSRLPDCRDGTAKLTSYRTDKLRYGRFAVTPSGAAKKDDGNLAFVFEPEQAWWDQLAVKAAENDGRVLLYIHGYREKFSRSARDTAQIKRLSAFDGPVIHYSWPSIGELLSYTVDQTSVSWDVSNFRRFLKQLAQQPWTKDIVIVSHSMGARLAIPGILYVDRTATPQAANALSNIILVSPDYDRQIFTEQTGPRILTAEHVKAGRRLTIYVSNSDQALDVARTVHGYPRLGRPYCFDPFAAQRLAARGLPERCYPDIKGWLNNTVQASMRIIDTTDLSVGSGHSNYLRSANVCRDFAAAIKSRTTQRRATALPHVFSLTGYGEKEKPAHDDICMRFLGS